MNAQPVIAKLRSRDESGLQDLLQHFGPLLRYVIKPFLSDERDREAVLQNVLLTVWEKIDSFDTEKGSWTSWLTAIARNAALNRARTEKRHKADELTEEEAALDPASAPEKAMLRKERRDALLGALASLKKSDRILFYRKYYYRQPTAQIAAELGLTERAVEGRLYRIKQKLKNLLEGELS